MYICYNMYERRTIMEVNATKLRTNLKDYIEQAAYEDIIITNKGEAVAKLVSLKKNKISILKSLVGIIPSITDEKEKEMKEERLKDL